MWHHFCHTSEEMAFSERGTAEPNRKELVGMHPSIGTATKLSSTKNKSAYQIRGTAMCCVP
jgi:hypothetical protein